MKPTKILMIIAATGLLAAMLPACAPPDKGNPEPVPGDGNITVRAAAPAGLTGELDVTMYVFSRPSGTQGDFLLGDMVTVASSGQRLEMKLAELARNDYRFFFAASQQGTGACEVVNSNRVASSPAAMAVGDKWQDLRVRYTYAEPASPDAVQTSLSIDNYYDVVDMSGDEILEAEAINGDLKRMVGQFAFDFFKGTGPTAPLDVDLYVDGNHADERKNVWDTELNPPGSRPETDEEFYARLDLLYAKVGSVMDRVYLVELEYEGITDMIRFEVVSTDPEVVYGPVPSGTTAVTLRQSLPMDNEDDNAIQWRITFPYDRQTALVDPEIAMGSARIKGGYFFPNETGMNVTLTLFYYDTTMTCNNPDGSESTHVHDATCYDKRSISLNLPAPGGSRILPVMADNITVTKASIPCNRIIDVPRGGGFDADDYEWTFQ